MMSIKKKALAPLAAATTVVLALAGCGGASDGGSGGSGDGPATAPMLRIGSLLEIQSWDPSQANEGHLTPMYQAVYDTLLKSEPDGTLAPMLATDWEWSEDNLALTFTLRDDVTFSDGAVFDSATVKANIENLQAGNGPLGTSLDSVVNVETPDPTTAILRLEEPDPGLEEWLAGGSGYMASPQALGTPGLTTMPVGSGPYVIDPANTVTGSKVSLDRNENYWGDALPYDEVEFLMLADGTARLNALKSGQIDATVFNRTADAVDAESSGLNHEPYYINFEGLLFFDRDGQLQPEMADVRVREALAISIDTESILEAVSLGRGELTNQTFGPDSTGYSEDLDTAYPYDPERAKELLAEAGAENMSITLPTTTTFDPAIYNAIIQSWNDIGVDVQRYEWGPGEAIPSMLAGDFPISYMSLGQRDSWNHIQFLISPDASWNPLGSEADELNELISTVQNGTEDEQAQAAADVNRYLVDEYWFAPFYRLERSFYYNDAVSVENQLNQAVPAIYNYRPTGQ